MSNTGMKLVKSLQTAEITFCEGREFDFAIIVYSMLTQDDHRMNECKIPHHDK